MPRVYEEEENKSSCSTKTVVVGLTFDPSCRELLTWALVKVAQPGYRVIALHVRDNNDVVEHDGKSCLLSLMKQFDSVLVEFEGICDLKQVDLKLKICRGESVRKILLREAISYQATALVVGIAKSSRRLDSSTSIAKYCAKKLGKVSSVIAVNNGKIVFHRGASSVSCVTAAESEHFHRGGILNSIQRALSRSSKVLNDECSSKIMTRCIHANHDIYVGTMKSISEPTGSVLRHKCAVCSPHLSSVYGSGTQSMKESEFDVRGNNTKAVVPIQKIDAENLVTLLSDKPSLGIKCADEIVPSLHCCKSDPLPQELVSLHELHLGTCRLFRYRELLLATSNFVPGNIVGKGSTSQVYKGCLPDGKEIAAKILKPSDDAVKEFVQEIEIMTTLHHKNIISLAGFCYEGRQLMLVYDLFPRGSLEENLHGNRNEPLLFGWDARCKVALGVAEALNYLHSRNDRPVIHRDVKSSNILLSHDYEPQLADFGLANWAASTPTHITSTDVAGTFGYLAPEYFLDGKVNDKTDVYAFGVVLLELISGRKPINNDYPKGEESLVMWARPILSCGKFTRLLDHCLGINYDCEQLERMVLAAALCIRRSPRARPKMSIVLKLLNGDNDIIRWARLQVNFVDGSHARLPLAYLEDMVDEETISQSNLQSHLTLALQGMEEYALQISNIKYSLSLEDYLKNSMNEKICTPTPSNVVNTKHTFLK